METLLLTIWVKGDDHVKLVNNLAELAYHSQHGTRLAPNMLGVVTDDTAYEAISARVVKDDTLSITPLAGPMDRIIMNLATVRQIKAYWNID